MTRAANRATQDLFHAGFMELADHWAGLGLWCTVWTTDGQLACPASQAAPLWKALWNSARGFHDELAHRVQCCAGMDGSAALYGCDALHMHCMRLHAPAAAPSLLVVCRAEAALSSDLPRLCSKWQLDETMLRQWLDRQLTYTPDQAGEALAAVRQATQALLGLYSQEIDIEQMTSQLTEAYEELSLIYRVGATMRVTQRPRDHFGRIFTELAGTTAFSTLAAVLHETTVLEPEDRLIIGGEPLVGEAEIRRVADSLEPQMHDATEAIIVNDLQEVPELHWTSDWLARLIAVPIVCHDSLLGVVMVLNKQDDQDFDSNDVQLLHSVADRSSIFVENVLLYGDLSNLLMGLLHALVSSIDAKDRYTCGHSNRVALVCRRLAEKTGSTPEQAERAYLTGLLHDVGKIGISELILCKPGRLTGEEMEEMKKHPVIGARILSGIKQLDDIIPGVLHHHEWISGRGYPGGLAGQHIPRIAKVVGLADAFDAMTTGRNYQNALPLLAAVAEIRRFAGVQFCPRLVDALVALVEEGLFEEMTTIRTTPAFDNIYTKWTSRIQEVR